jgi:ABC-2 type transport system ATP-binding protein
MRSLSEQNPSSMHHTKQVVLKAENLSKEYIVGKNRKIRAVDGIDFEVYKGEIFGFLGPNGAGKTTTIGMLTTRVSPTTGVVFMNGIDIWKDQITAKRLIAVVAQHNNLDRSLSVWENLIFHAKFFGIPQTEATKHAKELLDLFGLSNRRDDEVTKLSGGMIQRLKIVRALMHDPEIIFLDEPTTGLDPQSRVMVWEKIKELNSYGKTIFLTSHYMEEPDHLCDRVAIIDHGKIIALDSPSRLKQLIPSGNIVELTLSEINENLFTKVKNLPIVRDIKVNKTKMRLYVEKASENLAFLLHEIEGSGTQLLEFQLHRTTLDDVFFYLTGRGLRES